MRIMRVIIKKGKKNMTFIELEKILKKDGWYYYDSVGSHIQYKHKVKPRKSNDTKTQRRYKERNLKCYFKAGGY